MVSDFETAFKAVLGAEGAWSGDPNDPGNWTGGKVLVGELKGTKYGISAKAYPHLDIANLTLADAEAIYRKDFWALIRGDEIPGPLAIVMFDCAVNQGASMAIHLMQQTAGVRADGIFGKQTMAAIGRLDIKPAAVDFMARRAVIYATLDNFPLEGHGWMRRLFRLASSGILD